MSTFDEMQDPATRAAALRVFGLTEEDPAPATTEGAPQPTNTRTPDPVQAARFQQQMPARPDMDPNDFFGLTSFSPAWQDISHLI